MSEHLINDAAAIPVISGWIAMIKDMVPDEWKKKFLPVLAIICGLVYAFSMRDARVDVFQSIIMGVTLGFSAVGAHSAVKNGLEKIDGSDTP